MTLQCYLKCNGNGSYKPTYKVHFEDDQFTATKREGMLKLRPDAVPTVFIHSPKPKRRKPPSVRVPPEPSATDHTYFTKLNFGMIHAANNIPHFM